MAQEYQIDPYSLAIMQAGARGQTKGLSELLMETAQADNARADSELRRYEIEARRKAQEAAPIIAEALQGAPEPVKQLIKIDPEAGMKLWQEMRLQEQSQRQAEMLAGIFGGGGELNADAPTKLAIAGAMTGDPTLITAGGFLENKRKTAKEEGEKQEKKDLAREAAVEQIDTLSTQIDNAINHPGFSGAVGAKNISSVFGLKEEPFAGTSEAGALEAIKQIGGQQFLAELQKLKDASQTGSSGLGQLTEKEGQRLIDAASRMKTSVSEADFKEAAAEVKGILSNIKARMTGLKGTYKVPERGAISGGSEWGIRRKE